MISKKKPTSTLILLFYQKNANSSSQNNRNQFSKSTLYHRDSELMWQRDSFIQKILYQA